MKHNIALSIISAVCLVPMLFSCLGYDEDSPVRVAPSIEVWEKSGELYAGLDAVVEVFNSSLTFEIWEKGGEEWTLKPDYCIGEGAGNYHEWRLSYKNDVYLKPDAKYYYRAVLLLGGDSYFSETKTILASSEYSYEYVDLGLSVKWATCNLGATKPEEYGGYYQWAGLEDVTSTSIYLDYNSCPYHTGSDSETGWIKYIPSGYSSYWSGSGSPDNKTVLDSSDDVAYVKLGSKWRMPTRTEWRELMENCIWTWTTLNGVNGYKVTSKKSGYTSQSIFLPAASFRSYNKLNSSGSIGYYWSSSLNVSYPNQATMLGIESDGDIDTYRCDRYYGQSVRPVYSDVVSVTGVGLSQTSLSLNIGETYTLSATIVPSNAAEKSVSWSSNNTSVATVDQSGKVTAVKAGSATITVRTVDGGYTATCSVTVKTPNPVAIPEAVDLGLSVKWASFNIGAIKPEEYGGYYQWAGLEDVTSTGIDYDWSNCPYHTSSDSDTGWTKYVPSGYFSSSYWSGPGSPDNKTVLDLGDDVAHVKLGGKWRMPTDAEWTELENNCTWTWTTQNGVNGYKVTGKKSGDTGKSIFLPAAGFRNNLGAVGSIGYYWSSSLSAAFPFSACMMYFDSNNVFAFDGYRYFGLSVRPVSD